MINTCDPLTGFPCGFTGEGTDAWFCFPVRAPAHDFPIAACDVFAQYVQSVAAGVLNYLCIVNTLVFSYKKI